MTFTAYIQRQKSLIRSRRGGKRAGFCRTERRPVEDAQEIFCELISLKGLNTNEREYYSLSEEL